MLCLSFKHQELILFEYLSSYLLGFFCFLFAPGDWTKSTAHCFCSLSEGLNTFCLILSLMRLK